MNIKYWYEFKGLDEVLNRVEILCNSSVSAKEITGTGSPFSLEYINAKKLQPVYGSQATLGLISKSAFQFIDLHTDDMQGYLVKFYRAGSLYWMGWLDSELYAENLSDSPPYPVEFSGADFNILERLKFLDASDKPFTDINSLLVQLKRCFDKLALPFQRLYIGCTTLPEGVALSTSETALHKLYIQSSNFYDEDNEAMKCREVVESVLRPFGLMMIQRDANVYIFDYNAIKSGIAMKCYNFSTLSYVGDTAIPFELGDISDIGTVSVDASLGFEEMINNVNITSSIYAENSLYDKPINTESLSGLQEINKKDGYTEEIYSKAEKIENLNNSKFIIYKKTDSDSTLMGAKTVYNYEPGTIQTLFRVKSKEYLVGTEGVYYLNIKSQILINIRTNPFDDDEVSKEEDSSRAIRLYCNLYLTDTSGKPTTYYANTEALSTGWWTCSADGSFPQGKFCLFYCNNTVDEHHIPTRDIFNKWITNSDARTTYFGVGGFPRDIYSEKNYAKGLNAILGIAFLGQGDSVERTGVDGYPVFEITNKCLIDNPAVMFGSVPYPLNKVNSILLNNISLSVNDVEKLSISTDDYEFKSYINKKVASDMKGITLKCISANEEKLPVGRANILKKMDTHYELQLGYTRSGQTNILERLLMCTIHSNFTRKNKVISLDVHMTDNPAMRYCTYKNVIQTNGMIITGAKMDFYNATTKITAVDFSADEDKLSSIPYE